MKPSIVAFTLLAGILLSSGGLLVTHASNSTYGSHTQQPAKHQSDPALNLNLQGLIASAGSQTWNLAGGSAYAAQFGAETVQPGASLQYSLNAAVKALTSSGTFQLTLTGTTTDGQSISVQANGAVVGTVAAMCFPNYDTSATGVCAPTDSSQIPAFFEVGAVVSETLGTTTTTSQTVLLVETPIMNPWGSAIVISSTDGSIAIVTTYGTGMATWSNVLLTGSVVGTFNGQPASGSFFEVSNALENFVTGTEVEMGTVSLQAMTPSSLDASGKYVGTSKVPTDPSTMADCSAAMGTPTGTCTETGLSSTGNFQMSSTGSTGQHGGHDRAQGSTITGSYSVTWPQPSVTYTGTITATVSQSNHYNKGCRLYRLLLSSSFFCVAWYRKQIRALAVLQILFVRKH